MEKHGARSSRTPHQAHRRKRSPRPSRLEWSLGLSLDSLNELESLAEKIQVTPAQKRQIQRIAKRDGLNSRIVLIVAAMFTIAGECNEGRGHW
jgi:hypothetical protein